MKVIHILRFRGHDLFVESGCFTRFDIIYSGLQILPYQIVQCQIWCGKTWKPFLTLYNLTSNSFHTKKWNGKNCYGKIFHVKKWNGKIWNGNFYHTKIWVFQIMEIPKNGILAPVCGRAREDVHKPSFNIKNCLPLFVVENEPWFTSVRYPEIQAVWLAKLWPVRARTAF